MGGLPDDLFDLQDRIAAQVAGQISPSLRNAEIARASSRPPQNRSAYELLLTAYPHFWSLRQQDNAKAGEILDQALARDPDFVPAIALRAWVHAQQTTYMWAKDPASERGLALSMVERAAGLVGDHAQSLTAIGGAYAQAGSDVPLARTFLDRALSLDPSNAWAWIRLGWIHVYLHDVDPALAAFDRAERLSPLDPFLHQITFGRASAMFRWDGQEDQTFRLIEDGLRRHPGVVWPLRMLAVSYAKAGNMPAARDAAQRLLHQLPHLTIKYIAASLPPISKGIRDDYLPYLIMAGIPEE